jgi:preprotein translocase subunit SecB
LDDVRLSYGALREEAEFRLVIEASVAQPQGEDGFELAVTVGARFATDAGPELEAETAESTLLFIAFPYLRELIFDLTGRSPMGAVRIAPLRGLPAPSMWDVVDPTPVVLPEE